MRFLVTGGAGYLGNHIAKELNKAGHYVICLDKRETNCKYYHKKVIQDLSSSPRELVPILQSGIDTVFHLAGRIEISESYERLIEFWEDNVYGTTQLIKFMKIFDVKNIIYSSSAGVYKAKDRPLKETDEIAFNNPYANTKIAAESIIRDSGLNHVIFRFFNLAGADPDGEMGECHDPETHLIPLVFEKINNFVINGDTYNTNDGTCVRDYVHVTDIAKAHLNARDYLKKGGKSDTFNLGFGHGYSIIEVIELIKDYCSLDVKYTIGEKRKGDPSSLVADISKARKILNYRPDYGIIEIIRTAFNWHKNGKR
tara:strand:- start:275 stop:1210 length:936 start_codon:yes stop_codon:yes gene_type:complete